MKSILTSVVLLLTITLTFAQQNYKSIKADELDKLLKNNIALIDVRTAGEFAEGYIPGAKNADWYASDFMQKVATLKLDKTKPVYLYCRSGFRSGEAAKLLMQKGYTQVYSLDGGINAWMFAKKSIKK
jgi:rhodanese-related sulfurtransferase